MQDDSSQYLGVDFRPQVLEAFVRAGYHVVNETAFFRSRVRLLRPRSEVPGAPAGVNQR